jgi:ComF family protein
MVYERLKSIQDWLFPGICLLCTARTSRDHEFCPDCSAALPHWSQGCPQCAAPIAAGAAVRPCGACQQHPPVYSHTFAAFLYAPPIDRLIHGLKYHRRLEVARVLGGFLADRVERENVDVDLIMPVPLHTARLRQRGFNQALELARPVAKRLGVPLNYSLLERTRATMPQVGLPAKERRRNVRGAFAASNLVAGLRVALVDDVMTTGHTVNAAATCLRKAGTRQVQVWVIARAAG